MSKDKKIINESKQKFDSLINQIKERAASITIENFPNPEKIEYTVEKLKRKGGDIRYSTKESDALIANIFIKYWLAAFTEDMQLKSFIKSKLNLKESEDWFFNLNQILGAFKSINDTNQFKIDERASLVNIYNYIGIKIFSTIYNKYVGEKNNEPLIIDRVRNDIDTIKKAKLEERNHVESESIKRTNVLLSLTNIIFDDSNNSRSEFKKLQNIAKGNCESHYFPQIYHEYITQKNKKVEKIKLLVAFELFKIIIKDKYFQNEENFRLNNITYANYDAYRRKTVLNILKLK